MPVYVNKPVYPVIRVSVMIANFKSTANIGVFDEAAVFVYLLSQSEQRVEIDFILCK